MHGGAFKVDKAAFGTSVVNDHNAVGHLFI